MANAKLNSTAQTVLVESTVLSQNRNAGLVPRCLLAIHRCTRGLSLSYAALLCLFVVLLFPFMLIGRFGFYSRYWADDYCLASVLGERGYLQSQVYWYTSWTGRYSSIALLNAVQLAGVYSARVTPLLNAFGLVTTGVLAGRTVLPAVAPKCPRLAYWVAGLAVIFTVIHTNPDMSQLVFWQIVTMEYPLSLIVGALLLELVVQGRWSPILAGAVAFVGGGFTENYALAQLGLLCIWTLYVARHGQHRYSLRHAVWATGAATLAIVLVWLAPGNNIRLAEFQPAPSPLAALFIAVHALVVFEAYRFVFWTPLDLALALSVGVLVGLVAEPFRSRSDAGRWLRSFTLYCLIGVGLMLLVFAPSAYFAGNRPPPRAWIVSRLILASMSVLATIGIGRAVRPLLGPNAWRPAILLVTVGALAAPLAATTELVAVAPRAQIFAERWDAMASAVAVARDRGERRVVVRAMDPPFPVSRVSSDPTFWVNACASQYFGVEEIVAS